MTFVKLIEYVKIKDVDLFKTWWSDFKSKKKQNNKSCELNILMHELKNSHITNQPTEKHITGHFCTMVQCQKMKL